MHPTIEFVSTEKQPLGGTSWAYTLPGVQNGKFGPNPQQYPLLEGKSNANATAGYSGHIAGIVHHGPNGKREEEPLRSNSGK